MRLPHPEPRSRRSLPHFQCSGRCAILRPPRSNRRRSASTFDADILRDLPLGDNIYALLETTQADVIADRFNSGGLNVGGPSRLDGFLSSWSQTSFRIGDRERLGSQRRRRAALSRGDALAAPAGGHRADAGRHQYSWPRRHARTSPAFRADGPAPSAGSGRVAASSAGAPDDQPPPIARLEEYARGSAPGQRTDQQPRGACRWRRVGRLYEASAANSCRPRATPSPRASHTLTFAASPTREWRALGWVQRAERPFQEWLSFQDPVGRDAATPPSTCSRPGRSGRRRAGAGGRSAGFTQRSRAHEFGVPSVVMERISAGPVPAVVDEAAGRTTRRLAAGVRLAPSADSASRHQLEVRRRRRRRFDQRARSVRGDGARAHRQLARADLELRHRPDGVTTARRHRNSVYVADTIALSPTLTLEASLRARSWCTALRKGPRQP